MPEDRRQEMALFQARHGRRHLLRAPLPPDPGQPREAQGRRPEARQSLRGDARSAKAACEEGGLAGGGDDRDHGRAEEADGEEGEGGERREETAGGGPDH